MKNVEYDLLYTAASEPELDELVEGRYAGFGIMWTGHSPVVHLGEGLTGVLWKRGTGHDEQVRPLVLVCREGELRRLFGRYAQLRSDLSPLSAWCHILTPRFFDLLDSSARVADLAGFEAAWTGLVVAEASLLGEKPLSAIRVQACFATQSFAIARTQALWSQVSLEEMGKRFDFVNRLCRTEGGAQRGEARTTKVRSALEPIWSSLLQLSRTPISASDHQLRPICDSLAALTQARSHKDQWEARRLVAPLANFVPEAQPFEDLTELLPEQRLRLFDTLVRSLGGADENRDRRRRNALGLLAGYLATVAAGGAPSLTLAESIAVPLPEVTAWAYVLGGIGERIVWTSGFDGLGRLVARELTRSFRLDEAPTSDFAFDEASALADPKLADPLVRLRVKQARIATVSLYPGTNIAIPISDSSTTETGRSDVGRSGRPAESPGTGRSSGNPLGIFADALWPYLRGRVEDYVRMSQKDDGWQTSESPQNRSKRKSASQSQLPLKDSKK